MHGGTGLKSGCSQFSQPAFAPELRTSINPVAKETGDPAVTKRNEVPGCQPGTEHMINPERREEISSIDVERNEWDSAHGGCQFRFVHFQRHVHGGPLGR